MSDELKNAPQLWVGFINELLSEGMTVRVDHAPWKFFRWTTALLLCRDATLRRNGLYVRPPNGLLSFLSENNLECPSDAPSVDSSTSSRCQFLHPREFPLTDEITSCCCIGSSNPERSLRVSEFSVVSVSSKSLDAQDRTPGLYQSLIRCEANPVTRPVSMIDQM
jgi:hypothetical protein